METSVERAKTRGGRLDESFQRAVEANAEVGQMLTRMGQFLTRVKMQNSGGQRGDPVLAQAELLLDRGVEVLDSVIEPLAKTIEQGSHARFNTADGQMREALAGLQKLEARGAIQAVRLRGQMLGDLVLGLGDEFGSSGRRGRTKVGDEVGNGEVGLVAHCRNHGKPARRNRARDLLAVEGGEVFKRAATARDNNEIDEIRGIQLGQGGFNLSWCIFALDGDRREQDIEAGVAAIDDVQKVADHRARGRSDNAHRSREHGQRLFALGVEEAFNLEPLLQLLKCQLERAGANRFHGFGDELHLAALLVDAHAAAHQHVQTILRPKTEQHRLAAEENDGQLRFGVLQGEVNVAGRSGTIIRDLALNPNVAVLLLD